MVPTYMLGTKGNTLIHVHVNNVHVHVNNVHACTCIYRHVHVHVHVFIGACAVFRGLIPLHNACSYGHFEVAELLVKVCNIV